MGFWCGRGHILRYAIVREGERWLDLYAACVMGHKLEDLMKHKTPWMPWPKAQSVR